MWKIAVAGSGWVAGEYVKSILAHPDAELGGVFSQNPTFAKQRLAELGVETEIYESYKALVEDPTIDAVVLCSTPDVRVEQALLAAEHGKHLVLEKPVSLDKESLWRLAQGLTRHPVTTVVGFVLRWNGLFNITKSLIEDDALGRVFLAEVDYWHHIGPQYGQYRWAKTRSLGGSSLLSAGVHAVDALRYFVGEVEEVSAYSCKTWASSNYEFDPNIVAILKLKNGGVGKISSSLECKTPYKFNVKLLGEKGAMINNELYTHKFPGQTNYATIPTILPDSGDVTHHPFQDEMEDFINALRTGGSTRCDFFDAMKSMELCFAIDKAAATGKRISL